MIESPGGFRSCYRQLQDMGTAIDVSRVMNTGMRYWQIKMEWGDKSFFFF